MSQQPEALRLATAIERYTAGVHSAAIADDYNKAAALLRSQNAEIERLRVELAESATDLSRVLETVKYLSGIAERGEGRKIGESETVEQFVLGYVQKLETEAVRRCADFQEKKQ